MQWTGLRKRAPESLRKLPVWMHPPPPLWTRPPAPSPRARSFTPLPTRTYERYTDHRAGRILSRGQRDRWSQRRLVTRACSHQVIHLRRQGISSSCHIRGIPIQWTHPSVFHKFPSFEKKCDVRAAFLHLISSRPALPCPALPCPALPCPALPCPVLTAPRGWAPC